MFSLIITVHMRAVFNETGTSLVVFTDLMIRLFNAEPSGSSLDETDDGDVAGIRITTLFPPPFFFFFNVFFNLLFLRILKETCLCYFSMFW